MSQTVPARIIEITDDRAVVDALGRQWSIRTTLTPDVSAGSIVLTHAGFALTEIAAEEAEKIWPLLAELDETTRNQDEFLERNH